MGILHSWHLICEADASAEGAIRSANRDTRLGTNARRRFIEKDAKRQDALTIWKLQDAMRACDNVSSYEAWSAGLGIPGIQDCIR